LEQGPHSSGEVAGAPRLNHLMVGKPLTPYLSPRSRCASASTYSKQKSSLSSVMPCNCNTPVESNGSNSHVNSVQPAPGLIIIVLKCQIPILRHTLAMTTLFFSLGSAATWAPRALYSGVRCLQWPHLHYQIQFGLMLGSVGLDTESPFPGCTKHLSPQMHYKTENMIIPRRVELHEGMLGAIDVLVEVIGS
jgi:hypothetical protein